MEIPLPNPGCRTDCTGHCADHHQLRCTRTLTQLIIHCTATPAGRDVTVRDIDRWHRQRGWQGIGYHLVVYRDGSIHMGRPLDQIGAHCRGHNAHSVGVVYVGGLDHQGRPADTRTPAQRQALQAIVHHMRLMYPDIQVHGHNEFAAKACPCYDVSAEYGTRG